MTAVGARRLTFDPVGKITENGKGFRLIFTNISLTSIMLNISVVLVQPSEGMFVKMHESGYHYFIRM